MFSFQQRNNQRGITQIVLLLILVIGLIVGYYLVNFTKTNLRPKAYNANPNASDSLVAANQYDNAPDKATYNKDLGVVSVLTDLSRKAGFATKINHNDKEIVIDFEPEPADEGEEEIVAKRAFRKMAEDPHAYFYLKTLMYLLANQFDSVSDTPHVDPFYAMCEYGIPESVLEKIGARRTYLYGEGEGERVLGCHDPAPTAEQLGEVYGLPNRQGISFYKIPARHSLTFLQLALPVIEKREELLNAQNLAYHLVPFVGPYLEAVHTPGVNPNDAYFKIGAYGMVDAVVIALGGAIIGPTVAGVSAVIPAIAKSSIADVSVFVGERLIGKIVPGQVARLSETRVFEIIIETAQKESLKEGEKFSVKAGLIPHEQHHGSLEDVIKDSKDGNSSPADSH